jgi:hypothetical protein
LQEAEEKGDDYDRLKALETQADIADKLDASKRRKANPDTGFSSMYINNMEIILWFILAYLF